MLFAVIISTLRGGHDYLFQLSVALMLWQIFELLEAENTSFKRQTWCKNSWEIISKMSLYKVEKGGIFPQDFLAVPRKATRGHSLLKNDSVSQTGS